MANKQEHFVAKFDESAAAEIDAVRISEKPTNLYLDAWRDLRTRPMFYIAGLLIILVATMALFPGLFTQTPPNDNCLLANSNGAPTAGGFHQLELAARTGFGHALELVEQAHDGFSLAISRARSPAVRIWPWGIPMIQVNCYSNLTPAFNTY